MIRRCARQGATLVELLVVIAIISALFGITLPAIQKARHALMRVQCANNMRQMGFAIHQYHDSLGRLPPGASDGRRSNKFPFMSWHAHLLPWLEQENLWNTTVQAYQRDRFPFDNPPHVGLATVLQIWACPADGRTLSTEFYGDKEIALTNYLGVEGTNLAKRDGVFFLNSKLWLPAITDGLSNTLLVGERPPSPEFRFGWWYAGSGQGSGGSLDSVLGVREMNLFAGGGPFGGAYRNCPAGPYVFGAGRLENPCDVFHFWSLHPGGANFLLADGSVHFLSYSADAVLPALATRSGGEVSGLP